MAEAEFVLKDGTLLTPELEERLAREAGFGYDLSTAKRVVLRPGRPSKGEPRGESPRVAVRVPEVVYKSAKRRAAAEGRTISQVLRELLAGYADGDRLA